MIDDRRRISISRVHASSDVVQPLLLLLCLTNHSVLSLFFKITPRSIIRLPYVLNIISLLLSSFSSRSFSPHFSPRFVQTTTRQNTITCLAHLAGTWQDHNVFKTLFPKGEQWFVLFAFVGFSSAGSYFPKLTTFLNTLRLFSGIGVSTVFIHL